MFVTLYKKGEAPKQVPQLDANDWVSKFGWSREPVKDSDSQIPVESGETAKPNIVETVTDAVGNTVAGVTNVVKSTTTKK